MKKKLLGKTSLYPAERERNDDERDDKRARNDKRE